MHWKDKHMYMIKWQVARKDGVWFDEGRWYASKDGGATWMALAADNILDATEAIEEAARRAGVSPQMFHTL